MCCKARIYMMEEDSILCNGSAKGDVTPTLPWDVDYSPVANDISASPSCLADTQMPPYISAKIWLNSESSLPQRQSVIHHMVN